MSSLPVLKPVSCAWQGVQPGLTTEVYTVVAVGAFPPEEEELEELEEQLTVVQASMSRNKARMGGSFDAPIKTRRSPKSDPSFEHRPFPESWLSAEVNCGCGRRTLEPLARAPRAGA